MIAALLLLWACTPDDVAGDSGGGDAGGGDFLDPSLPGPWPVGTDARALTNSWGTELLVQTWYPRAAAEGTPHSYDGLLSAGALDGGEAACETPRPVVMFSHGNGGMRWQSFYLTEHLASQGFVVVAPDHTHNTFLDLDDAYQAELIFRRPVDIAESFDALLARSADPGDVLHGCVDPDGGYAMMGHSFGGYTTLAIAGAVVDTEVTAGICAAQGGWLCDEVAQWAAEHPEQTTWDLSDDRAWAAVAMTPAAYETLAAGLQDIAIPTQVQVGELDTLTPWVGTVEPIWQALAVSPRSLAEIEDAGHFSFSDACALIPTYDECEPPFADPDEVHDISRTLALAWVQQARGHAEAAAWLPPPDDARVKSWEAW